MIKKLFKGIRLNKQFIIITLPLVAIIIILFIITRKPPVQIKPEQKVTPTPSTPSKPNEKQIPYEEEIYPGFNTEKEAINKLGEPKNTSDWQEYTILNYPSNSKWDNQIFTKNGEIYLITEQADKNPEITRTKLTEKYGVPSITLYGPISPGGNLYAYPNQGFAFIGSDVSEIIFQIWYFSPQSELEFITTIAKEFNYTSRPPDQEFGADYGDLSPGL